MIQFLVEVMIQFDFPFKPKISVFEKIDASWFYVLLLFIHMTVFYSSLIRYYSLKTKSL